MNYPPVPAADLHLLAESLQNRQRPVIHLQLNIKLFQSHLNYHN